MDTTLNDVLQAINSVGFPIVISIYTLFKLNKTIENNTKVMIQVATKLDIPVDEGGQNK
jgi:hypothetical protein